MTTSKSNQFVDRASDELERLVKEARESAKSVEDLVSDSIGNLQRFVEDLVGRVSDELERMWAQTDEQ